MKIALKKQELLGLDGDARGICIRCEAGRLWITQAGDSRDHLLAVGDSFTVASRGRVVIVALEGASLEMAVPARSAGRNGLRLAPALSC